MDAQSFGGRDDRLGLDVDSILGRPVAIGSRWRSDGGKADRDHAIFDHELEQLRLGEARVQFHLVGGRSDSGVSENQLQLGYAHVGGTDVAHKTPVDELLEFAPGRHVLIVYVGPRVFGP